MKRDYSIDLFKGFLVIGMVLVHVMQFFTSPQYSQASEYIINIGNMITFSGFVFCFGYAVQISYMEKNFNEVYFKIIKRVLTTLIAFYISGIAYRLIVGRSYIIWDTFKNILLLKDIPGWSEFLISFTYFNLATLILFKPFKIALSNLKVFFIVIIILMLTCFIPYEKVTTSQLGILLGTKKFAAFPILQYMPFYMLGMYFKKYDIKFSKIVLAVSFLLTSVPLYLYISTGKLPSRFPPSVLWIISPVFILYLYYLVSLVLERQAKYLTPIIMLGQNVLTSLLISNILIFTLNSLGKGLKLNTIQCVFLDILLLSIVLYIVGTTHKDSTKKLNATSTSVTI